MNYKMLTCLNEADPLPLRLGAKKYDDPDWWMSKEAKASFARQKELEDFERGDHSHKLSVEVARPKVADSEAQSVRKAATWNEVLQAARKLQAVLGNPGYVDWLKKFQVRRGCKAVSSDAAPIVHANFLYDADATLHQMKGQL